MIKFLRNRFARKEDPPSLAAASYTLISREYGVKDSQGETAWFVKDSSEDSLSEALWYFDAINEGKATLMSRLVSPGREVDHERFRS